MRKIQKAYICKPFVFIVSLIVLVKMVNHHCHRFLMREV